MKNKLRLCSGLILFVFVLGHLINHSFGLISLEMMQKGTKYLLNPWHTLPGMVLFFGALLIHTGVALYALWERKTLKMTIWEWAQIVLGLSIPYLLALHVLGTRVMSLTSAFEPSYLTVLGALWVNFPLRGIVQALALLVVWGHACIGLHFWLRVYPTYQKVQALALVFAVLIPTLSLAGYVAAGNQVLEKAKNESWLLYLYQYAHAEPWMVEVSQNRETWVWIVTTAILIAIFAGRRVRGYIAARRKNPRLYYSPDGKVVELVPGASLLETIRAAGIPHASVCGGRGRCSTCRVRIGKGLENLDPADEQEQKVLSRISESPTIRLACQMYPNNDIEAAALVRPDADAPFIENLSNYRQGQELNVAFLFVDLRGSTKLSEERLPFDVVFILNQFFAELSLALKETNGHYAQFNGDGLLAIYGLESGPDQGCLEALQGAQAMFRRLAELNQRLSGELAEDLKIGIGIHAGEAIVGTMGPPQSPIVSALGDNVNIAARLESQTKEFGVPLVVSTETARRAGLGGTVGEKHTVQVKGRAREVEVLAISDVGQLRFEASEKVA